MVRSNLIYRRESHVPLNREKLRDCSRQPNHRRSRHSLRDQASQMRKREGRNLQAANLYAEIARAVIRARKPLLPAVIVLLLANVEPAKIAPRDRQASLTASLGRIKKGPKNS